MSLSLEDTYACARQCSKLEAAALARTLTNNPAAGVLSALDTEANAMATLLDAVIVPPTSAVVASGVPIIVPVTGTYTSTITPTVVDGVITGFVLG